MSSSINTVGENCNITEKGFVYSTNNTPTIDGAECSKIVDDDLNAVLSGLECNTTYYVRSYATNEKGTGYSTVKSFKTSACSSYTITWSNNGSDTTTTITQDEAIGTNLPADPTSCSDTYSHFVGWFTEVAGSESSPSNAPQGNKVTAETKPNGNDTYYAVFSDGAGDSQWELVTSTSDLVAGGTYTIASSSTAKSGKALGTQNENNRAAVDWSSANPTELTLGGNATDGWTFYDATGSGYLYAASSTKNYLRTQTILDDNGKWTIEIATTGSAATITAKGENTHNLLRYNSSNSPTVFSCYSIEQSDVYLFHLASTATGYISACGPYVRVTAGKDVYVTAGNAGGTRCSVQVQDTVKFVAGALKGSGSNRPSIKIPAADIKIGEEATTKLSCEIKQEVTDNGDGTYSISGYIVLKYKPTEFNKTEDIQVQLRAEHNTTNVSLDNFTVHARALPQKFVIAAKHTDGKWYALNGDMSGSNTQLANAHLEVDNANAPTQANTAACNTLYTFDGMPDGDLRYVRFIGTTQRYLWAATNENTGIQNYAKNTPTAATDAYNWLLQTNDNVTYRFANKANNRTLALYKPDVIRFGMYTDGNGTHDIRILPVVDTCVYNYAPTNINVIARSQTATLTWDAVAGADKYQYRTIDTDWKDGTASPTITLSGLSQNTEYTYFVRAVHGTSNNICSDEASVTFTTANCDDVPYDISYTSDANSITLTWKMTSATATVQVFSDAEETTPVGDGYTGKTSPFTIQNLDKATTYYVKILAGGTCQSALVEVSTERPQLDVVEWYENKIDVEINTDEKISVLLENQVTKGTGSGKVAEDLFFSKYFEATGTLKLIGIYNGTNTDVDVSNLKIKIGAAGTYNMGAGCGEDQENKKDNPLTNNTIDISTLGIPDNKIPMGTEIIIYTMGNATTTMVDASTKTSACIENTLNDYFGDSKGVERDNWYSSTNCVWAGRQTIALYNGNDMIDVIGAYWKDGTTIKADGTHIRCYNEVSTYFSDPTASYSGDDPGWFARGKNYLTDEEIILSTNRCLLIRSNSVTSGADAVEQNRTPTYTKGGNFSTLGTEWKGLPVGGSHSGYESNKLVCDNFSAVSQFDYNGYYTTYDSLTTVKFDNSKRNPDGTLTINIPRLDTLSCRGLKIIASDESGHVLTTKEYRVPIIVCQSTTTADAKVFHFSKDTCKTCDVVVRPNIKLQAKAESDGGKVRFRNMMVYAKGNFEIPTGVDFMLDNLEMHAKNDTVAYALIDGSLKVSNKITHVKRINSVTRDVAGYHFALPYPCDGTSIRQYNGNSLGEYDVDWVVFYYDGAARAETGTWNEAGTGYNGKSYWRTFPTADFELQPNVAYIIATAGNSLKSVYFPPKASKGYSDTTYTELTPDSKTVAVKAYTGTAAELHANDRGWNFIGHPYISMFNHATSGATGGTNNDKVKMGYWEGTEYSETDKVYVNVPQHGVTSYEQDEAANLKMSPFLGYFVQVAGEADAALTFIKGARELSAAPMMRTTSVRDEHAEVALKLTAPSGEFDRTTILVDEAYTVDYEINRDLGKMARAKGLPRFYSISMEGLNEKMCYQALPSAVAENNVPLGFYAYEAGTYTIAIDSTRGDLSAVTAVALKVDGNVVHDLLSGPYTFAVSKARSTDNDSFSVSIQRKAQVTTDVNVVGNSDAVAPVVYTQGHRIHIQQLPLTGRLHIIDAVGRTIVDEQLDGCSERQYTLATDGVYVVRVATDSNVFIVKVAIR